MSPIGIAGQAQGKASGEDDPMGLSGTSILTLVP